MSLKISENDERIIVFSRSRELNGINEIKRSLTAIDSKFIVATSLVQLFKIMRKERTVSTLFCLASSDFLLAVFLTQLLRSRVPIVHAVYHPKQWSVMLDADYSSRRAQVFGALLGKLTNENVIYNSRSAYEACMSIRAIDGAPRILLAPSLGVKNIPASRAQVKSERLRLVTVSRYVDFKVCTIRQMIKVVDSLNASGRDIEYHIYGEGPARLEIEQSLAETQFPERIILHDFLDPSLFSETVSGADLFFGMGFAVVHAAMLGVPSLIAIQYELGPKTYGFFSEFDHGLEPMFGDQTPGVERVSIEEKLRWFSDLSSSDRKILGAKCKLASDPYDGEVIVTKLHAALRQAGYVSYPKVSLFDIVFIRVQTYCSRIFGRSTVHS